MWTQIGSINSRIRPPPSSRREAFSFSRLAHLCALPNWRLKGDRVLGLWLPDWFGVFPVVVRHTNWVAAVGCHQINFPVAIPIRLESEQGSIRRPGWHQIIRGIIREALHATPIAVHNVYFPIAVLVAFEGNPGPIRRPGWRSFVRLGESQLLQVGAIRIDQEDIVIAILIRGYNQAASIRRPVRRRISLVAG